MLPLFATFSFLQTAIGVHVIGSHPPIIFTCMTFGLPLPTWLLAAYLRTIPRELEDAGLPVAVLHPIFQRYLIRGLSAGSMTGM